MNSTNRRPDQLVSSSTKNTKAWQESNANYLAGFADSGTQRGRRKSLKEMRINWRAFSGILSSEDMKDTFDPLRAAENKPDQIPFQTNAYNKIKMPVVTFVNEGSKRKSDVVAVAINDDIVNLKSEEFKQRLYEFLGQQEQMVAQGQYDESIAQERLEKLDYWRKYEQRTAHEVMANQMLQYIQKDPYIRLDHVFTKGLESKSVIGEAVYCIDSVGNELRIRKVNSERFIVLGLGDSQYIEDGNAWIEWDYMSIDDLVAEFKLSRSEIKTLYEKQDLATNKEQVFSQATGYKLDENADESKGYSLELTSRNENDRLTPDYADEDGNILVVRFQWITQRKVGELTRFDEDDNEVVEIVDEYYKPDQERGETIEWFYVNEVWSGVKIGEDLIKNVEPNRIQMRSISNPAIVRPTYVGSLVAYGETNKAVALVDDMLSYQRDYNLIANKLRQMWIKHIGPIFRISKSRIPKELDVSLYLTMLKSIGVSVEDDFNESPQGTFSGNMQSQSPVANLSWAAEMRESINQLLYLEQQINAVAAMPDARQGNLSGNEVLGTTQQAIISASTATANYFKSHENDKIRVLTVALEYLKELWRDEGSVKRQYQLSDLSSYVLQYDANVMSEAEFGVIVTDGSVTAQLEQDMNMLGHAFAQNGQIGFSDLFALRTSNSPSEMIKKLEAAEEKQRKYRLEESRAAEEARQQTMQMQFELEKQRMQLELEKMRMEIELKSEARIREEEARATNKIVGNVAMKMADENGDGVVDDVELKREQIKADNTTEVTRLKTESAERIARLQAETQKAVARKRGE